MLIPALRVSGVSDLHRFLQVYPHPAASIIADC